MHVKEKKVEWLKCIRGQWPHFSLRICECVGKQLYTSYDNSSYTKPQSHHLHFISRSSEDTHISVSALAGRFLCQCVIGQQNIPH